MTERRPLGPREREVMEVLWSAEAPATVHAVRERLSDRHLSYTTVMTVLDNLHRKGWVLRDRRGRAWVYRPSRSRTEHVGDTMAAALGDAADRSGALARFVGTIGAADQAALRALLAELERDGDAP